MADVIVPLDCSGDYKGEYRDTFEVTALQPNMGEIGLYIKAVSCKHVTMSMSETQIL